MNSWIENNYDRLYQITKYISKNNDVEELFQVCIEQVYKNKKFQDLIEEHKFFFWARIVRNNYYSFSSPYGRLYKNRQTEDFKDPNIPDVEYEEFDELKWVEEQISLDKKTPNWYYARLFEIYIDQGCSISKTSKKTTIPLNSVSRDVNKYRKWLKERRKNRQS